MKWTEDTEIQKVHKMRLANNPYRDALHFSKQQSITGEILHIISGQAFWLLPVKGGFLADENL